MKKTNIISRAMFALVAAVLMLAGLTGCNDSNGQKVPGDESMTDFVTLTGATDKGFTVTLRKEDDSPLVTLTFTDQRIDTKIINVGDRFLLSYRPESGVAYKSGPAVAYAYRPIANEELEYSVASKTGSWITMAVRLNALWRTGNYINVMALCQYNTKPKKFALVVDEETLDSEIPEAYLLFDTDAKVEASELAYYATFDISSLWERQDVKGLRVIAVTTEGTRRVTFHKDVQNSLTPNE